MPARGLSRRDCDRLAPISANHGCSFIGIAAVELQAREKDDDDENRGDPPAECSWRSVLGPN